VFTLGPEKSRPFINALHFFISIGFLLGTFLVQPFLPATSDKVCSGQTKNNDDETSKALNVTDAGVVTDAVIPLMQGVQCIAWPFIISGGIIPNVICFC
jgi:hypothetical protein